MKRLILLFALAPWILAAAPVRILIAYHSETGNTETLAKSVREGMARVAGVEVMVRKTSDASAEDILRADGIVLGTPVYWQDMSAEARRFVERVGEALSKAGKELGEGRTAGVFCTGGAIASGKDLTRLSAVAAFLAMRFIVIGGVDEEGYGTTGAQATTAGEEKGSARRNGKRRGALGSASRG
ncbi:MAG TPA: NAD(P)H-dependent oxidoreductase [Bryobacteraceae bacterium]|nr:NAD(P)H-dependent oxidoreductase [Bryobacteraceae bacterium]HPQ15373.1 NAD(P)H-dependent oxidoreductase [Bryobacteraceae bacterium]